MVPQDIARKAKGDTATVARRDTAKAKPAEPAPVPSPAPAVAAQQADSVAAPVFKVQILASVELLAEGNSQFKGLTGVESFREGRMYKYMVGASADYAEVVQLRKSLADKFPQAFIVAFRGAEKMDVQEALREYRAAKAKTN